MSTMARPSILNVNIGVLGHVDSGKTSLARRLSTVGSTAAFDKHPQSKERGITIDLGFSSFTLPCPEHLVGHEPKINEIQYTLVDCPGHASLIRTIIGGASIIDLMILVIDITKGMQTQTAECLIIGELTCDKMIVVLNKIDLIEPERRDQAIEKMSKRMEKTLEKTRFKNCPIVPISARVGGGDLFESPNSDSLGIDNLLQVLSQATFVPPRNYGGPLIFYVDHCFSIKGQGTILTGTVYQGTVRTNDTIEIPSLKVTKKIKSMQMFRKPVQEARQGDRLGICVTQFESKLLERGVVSSPNLLFPTFAIIAQANKISYFKGPCRSKAKFHVSIVHETVMAQATFFKGENALDLANEFEWIDELDSQQNPQAADKLEYVVLEFERPVFACSDQLFIASKLDSDINANVCRLAFHGRADKLFHSKEYREELKQSLKIFKFKTKIGTVDRIVNDYELIVKLFKKEYDIKRVEGMKVYVGEKELPARIVGSFGQSGKIKISLDAAIESESVSKGSTVKFTFKKFIYQKVIRQ